MIWYMFSFYLILLSNLNFNQVGDLPTRFKYASVQPTDYALTPAEILMATDKELNEYMSVKKYAPYRRDNPDKHRWNKTNQEKLRELKTKVTERSGGAFGSVAGRPGRENGEERTRKRKGKKERLKARAALGGPDEEEVDGGGEEEAPGVPAAVGDAKSLKKRKRDNQVSKVDLTEDKQSVDNGDVEEAAPRKKKRRHRKKDSEVAQS